MKNNIYTILVFLMMVMPALAHPQAKHLKEAYKSQGDAFFAPLYWLPETRDIVRTHIPNHEDWVGFEADLWKKFKEEEKLQILEALGKEFERMESAKLEATWKRIRDWQSIRLQLSVMANFLDSEEAFLNLAYRDPVLRPAFKHAIDKRPANFDASHIGESLSSGEMAQFYPILTEYLLDVPEARRYECFSRLFARIAQSKTGKEEQAGTANSTKQDN